jgi:hypothetical protein
MESKVLFMAYFTLKTLVELEEYWAANDRALGVHRIKAYWGMLSPYLISSDPDEVGKWLLKLTNGSGDVINNRSVSRELNGKFYVQGWKRPMTWNIAAQRLAKLRRRRKRFGNTKALPERWSTARSSEWAAGANNRHNAGRRAGLYQTTNTFYDDQYTEQKGDAADHWHRIVYLAYYRLRCLRLK